jgi:hypothetical protein
MPKYDRGKSQSQTCADNNQQDTANHAIPAMAMGRTTPENGATCFRLIGQLLPTFDASVRG